jgi:hypothetical protein
VANLAGVCHRGTAFDTGDYSGTGDNNHFCDDKFSGPGKPSMNLGTAGDIAFPAGTSLCAMIVMTGDTSRSWGWYVYQRDGFEKPDQFGYAPMATTCRLWRPSPSTIRRPLVRHHPALGERSRGTTFRLPLF